MASDGRRRRPARLVVAVERARTWGEVSLKGPGDVDSRGLNPESRKLTPGKSEEVAWESL